MTPPDPFCGRLSALAAEALSEPEDPRGSLRRRNSVGGTPVFVGTRVPFQNLLDYLEAGDTLEDFLDDFPTVTREQAIAALEQAKEALLADARSAR